MESSEWPWIASKNENRVMCVCCLIQVKKGMIYNHGEKERKRRMSQNEGVGNRQKKKFGIRFLFFLESDPILRFCCFTTGSYLRRERRRRARKEHFYWGSSRRRRREQLWRQKRKEEDGEKRFSASKGSIAKNGDGAPHSPSLFSLLPTPIYVQSSFLGSKNESESEQGKNWRT